MQTISSAIAWWAKNTPDTVALSFAGERITYRALHDTSERIARWLIDRGVDRGDRVGVCAANSAEYCALILGILRAGAIVAPLNMRYTTHELSELVGDTSPRMIFADAERAPRLADLGVDILSLDTVRAQFSGQPVAIDREPLPDDPVVIIATSGSTAKPKGVVFSNRTMTSYAAGYAMEESRGEGGSRVIVPAPLSTSAGFVQLIHYTQLGFTLFFESAFDPERFLEILVEERITAFGAVPHFFERVAASKGFSDADLSAIRIATTGGASVSRALQDAWAAKGVVLRQIYGQTECGGNATLMPANLAMTYPEKCGRGGIFTELAIVDEAGKRLPPGQPGQILIRGPSLMVGYWNNPEATAEVLRDGWLYTGDIGVVDEDGLLTFVDRMKDIIISGGLNISAAEVERAVASFGGIIEVMVIAAKDQKFGETPLAIVHASGPVDVKALIAHCNDRLADYKVPRYVAFEDEPMPRTATGKLSKPTMRQKYANAAEVLPRVR